MKVRVTRRDFAFQIGGATAVTSQPIIDTDAQWMKDELRRKEYAICRVRGHVATISHGTNVTLLGATSTHLTTMIVRPDEPETKFVEGSATDWQTCFYCGTLYRFVTKIEERDAPPK